MLSPALRYATASLARPRPRRLVAHHCRAPPTRVMTTTAPHSAADGARGATTRATIGDPSSATGPGAATASDPAPATGFGTTETLLRDPADRPGPRGDR